MTFIRIIQLICDGPDCPEAYASEYSDLGGAAGQRAKAKELGWRVGQPGGKDYCPTCAATQTEGNGP